MKNALTALLNKNEKGRKVFSKTIDREDKRKPKKNKRLEKRK